MGGTGRYDGDMVSRVWLPVMKEGMMIDAVLVGRSVGWLVTASVGQRRRPATLI